MTKLLVNLDANVLHWKYFIFSIYPVILVPGLIISNCSTLIKRLVHIASVSESVTRIESRILGIFLAVFASETKCISNNIWKCHSCAFWHTLEELETCMTGWKTTTVKTDKNGNRIHTVISVPPGSHVVRRNPIFSSILNVLPVYGIIIRKLGHVQQQHISFRHFLQVGKRPFLKIRQVNHWHSEVTISRLGRV